MKVNKQKWIEHGMILLLFTLCILLPVGWAVGIDWIQYNERLAGENSPFYDDVLNRPGKEIWQNFTSEHTEAGAHKPGIIPTPLPTSTPMVFPTPLPTPTPVPLENFISTETFTVAHNAAGRPRDAYLYDYAGTGNLASGTFSPSGFFVGENPWSVAPDQWTIVATIIYFQRDRAESFYWHISTQYSLNILNFGKTSDNKLSLAIGATTYTSSTAFFNVLNEDMPMEVAVVCDKVAETITFCADGICEAAITGVTYTFPTIPLLEQHVIGDSFAGAVRLLGVSRLKLFAPNSSHTPISALAQVPQALVYYDPARNDDAWPTLTDQVYWLSSYAAAHHLTVNADVGNGFPTW